MGAEFISLPLQSHTHLETMQDADTIVDGAGTLRPGATTRYNAPPHQKEDSMNAYYLLAIAITAEVIATTSMKAVKGLSTPLPLALVIIGYAIAFWMLILVVRTIPVGITYAIWSGLGIVLVSLAAFFVYGQKLDLPAMLGLGLIVLGVVVIQLFSKTAGH